MKKTAPAARPAVFLSIEDELSFGDGLPDAIVPVVFSKGRRKIEGECYFGAYPALRSFLYKHADDPFSKKALTELNGDLAPYLKEIGYERRGGELRYYRSFVLWDKNALNGAAILPDSSPLSRGILKKVKVNRTGFDLDELLDKKLETVVALIDGELASIASVNEHSPDQRLLELTVYTRPAYRGRGLGSSCTALLAKTLLEKKRGVVYVCSCRNAASIALANRIGLKSENRFYAVDAYKK